MTPSTDIIRVTYVEDEPSIALLLKSGLGLFGIQVNPIYMSAEQFMDNVHSGDFDNAELFMFDIRLPRMTGLELAQSLRNTGEERPFVLVSAWPPPPEEQLRELSASFLPKPFDFPDIVRTIQQLVR
jgi:two-component system, OmpR family, response regulator MprA